MKVRRTSFNHFRNLAAVGFSFSHEGAFTHPLRDQSISAPPPPESIRCPQTTLRFLPTKKATSPKCLPYPPSHHHHRRPPFGWPGQTKMAEGAEPRKLWAHLSFLLRPKSQAEKKEEDPSDTDTSPEAKRLFWATGREGGVRCTYVARGREEGGETERAPLWLGGRIGGDGRKAAERRRGGDRWW